MKKPYPIIHVAVIIVIAISMLGFIGCSSLILSDEPETVELLQSVFPEAGYYQYDEEARIYTVYNTGKKKMGYAYITKGAGYSGVITVMVGLEDKETIKGIYVVSHSDHLGGVGEAAGPPLDFSPWDEQFEGLKIEDCYLAESDGQVDAITEATVSSRKVVDMVRKSALEKIQYIE